jgi:hypothetical protein
MPYTASQYNAPHLDIMPHISFVQRGRNLGENRRSKLLDDAQGEKKNLVAASLSLSFFF